MKNGQSLFKMCPVNIKQELIGGKWKIEILFLLSDGTKRFNELHRLIHGITQAVLTQQLRELERDKLIHREIYAEIPPRVEYSLSQIGLSFLPVLDAMGKCGREYIEKLDN